MKRRKRKRLPPITTRTRPWGATKQAADCFEQIRNLKNRICELEKELVATGTKDTSWHPNGTEIAALGKVVMVSALTAKQAGIDGEVMKLTDLYLRLEAWNKQRLLAVVELIRNREPEVGDDVLVHLDSELPIVARVEEVSTRVNGKRQFFARCKAGAKRRVVRLLEEQGLTWSWP